MPVTCPLSQAFPDKTVTPRISVFKTARVMNFVNTIKDIEKQQKDANTACPTIIHYFALYGKTDLLNWIFGKIKSSPDPKIKMKRFLEEKANFGEEIGLMSVTPLVCGISSHNVDTVR